MSSIPPGTAAGWPYPNDEHLRAVLDAIPTLVWFAGPDGAVVHASRRWLAYAGLTAEQAAGWGWTSAVHPDDVDRVSGYWRTALDAGAACETEARLRRFDGQHRWMSLRTEPLTDGSGTVTGWWGTFTEIDDRHRAVEAARAAEQDLRLVLDNVPALVKTLTPTGTIDFANQRLLDFLGVGLDQIQDWLRFIHESDRAMMLDCLKQSFESEQPYQAECRLLRADGVYRWVQGSAVPARGLDGSLVRWYYVIIDIDDRKAVEDLLRSSERQFRAIVDNIPALVGVITETGEVEIVNRASLDFHGRSLEEIKQWKGSDLLHPDDLGADVDALTRAFQTGQPFQHEHRLRRADGEYRWFQLRALRSFDHRYGGPRWYTVEIDIHDRKLAEQALQESETRLLEVQRLSRTGAWRFDLAAGIVESSPEIRRAYAVQPDEDVLHPPFWFDRIHEDDRPRVQAEFQRCMREKADYQAGYRIVLPDGSIRYQYATGHPTLKEGELVEFIGASMDMTEHWLAMTELERASEAVRDLQLKMSRAAQVATVGELAASIAHEVNQPLAAVVATGHACLRWLATSPPNIAKAVDAAERMVKDGKDAGEVIRRVRSLFNRTTLEKVSLDANEVIREVLRLLDSYPARRDVTLETALAPGLFPLVADRVQLQQLVLNLVLNALEAVQPVSGRAKKLTVRSSCTEADGVQIQVADNGIGLDHPDTAFEPFVTTKPEGMGLGLAICRSIVAAHDGKLTADRNVGFGTTFTVTLPTRPADGLSS